MRIDRLGPKDADRLGRLLVWRKSGQRHTPSAGDMLAVMRAHLCEPTLYVWGAVSEDEPGGDLLGYTAVARIIKPDPRQFFYVDELWVPEAHRRRGIASALLDAMLAKARQEGMWRVRLQAADTVAARALYVKAGFRVEPGGWAEHMLD